MRMRNVAPDPGSADLPGVFRGCGEPEVLAIRRRIAIVHQYIAAINAILDVINLRVKAGATSRLDLAREQAQLESVQAQLPALETLEKQALYSLAVLLGRPPEGFDIA